VSRRFPSATPEEIAVVTAAARALLTVAPPRVEADTTPAWRFSGRWFQPRSR
jgi:hypothetical protein